MQKRKIQALPTWYGGQKFRSQLEARWAVFFDLAKIPWEYEPMQWKLSTGFYMPDFRLTDCGTWVEVKPIDGYLDRERMLEAARSLPHLHYGPGESCTGLMLLGELPEQPLAEGDWGWTYLTENGEGLRHGFGQYYKNRRPWVLDNAQYSPRVADDNWMSAIVDEYEGRPEIRDAYIQAGTYRFPPAR